jgi:hypothetical protein
MKTLVQELVGKTIARVELDTDSRFGFNPERDTALSALVFTDGTRLEVSAIMAGGNDSEPFSRIELWK